MALREAHAIGAQVGRQCWAGAGGRGTQTQWAGRCACDLAACLVLRALLLRHDLTVLLLLLLPPLLLTLPPLRTRCPALAGGAWGPRADDHAGARVALAELLGEDQADQHAAVDGHQVRVADRRF